MNTTRAAGNRPSVRRVAGAIGSALAVTVVGIGVLPAATAHAAGIRTTGSSGVPARPPHHRPLADPASPAAVTTTVSARYQFTRRDTVAVL